jgi:hypothetical protein
VNSLAIKLVLGSMVALLIAIFVVDRIRRKRRWQKIGESLGLAPQRVGSAGMPELSGAYQGRRVSILLTEKQSLAQTLVRVELERTLGLGLAAFSIPWTTAYANSGFVLAFYDAVGRTIADAVSTNADRFESSRGSSDAKRAMRALARSSTLPP